MPYYCCALFTVMPYYVALAPCYSMLCFRALLLYALISRLVVLLLHLAFTPYCFTFAPCFRALLLYSYTLFPCLTTLFLHLATIYYCVLLLLHFVALVITPCYLHLLPYCHCLAIVPCCLPFSGTFPPQHIVASSPCCSLSYLVVLPCQLVFLLHSLVQVDELGATPINFIQ